MAFGFRLLRWREKERQQASNASEKRTRKIVFLMMGVVFVPIAIAYTALTLFGR